MDRLMISVICRVGVTGYEERKMFKRSVVGMLQHLVVLVIIITIMA